MRKLISLRLMELIDKSFLVGWSYVEVIRKLISLRLMKLMDKCFLVEDSIGKSYVR